MFLDDLGQLGGLDTQNMRRHLDSLADHLEAAWTLGQGLPVPSSFNRVDRIVVVGMGTSALAGELLAALVADSCNVPIIVYRGYELPAFVDGQSTLVVVVSVSGTTEETLAALDLADARGTQLLVITANTALASRVESRGATAWIFKPDVPETLSRAVLGWTFGLLISLVNRLGLIADLSAEVADAVQETRSRVPLVGLDGRVVKNPTKRMAGQLIGRIPVIYGSGILSPVAKRWVTQINENAKTWAQWGELPEHSHNALSGIIFPRALMTKVSVVILASPQYDHERVKLRQEITKKMLLQQGIAVDVIKMRGGSRLSQMLNGIQYGDYVSYYVAMCYEVDPTPTHAISDMKDHLANAHEIELDSHD
jgi:glucose/mannose-6-phosphate isomerase